MGRTTRPALALIATLIVAPITAAADTVLWKNVGGWDISFYPGSEGCQAFAVFEQDTAFFIGFDSTGDTLTLEVTILDQRWGSIEQGKEYDISVKFGNESPWNVSMDGLNIDGYPGLNIEIDASTDQASLFVDEFQRETRMAWSYSGALLGQYTLRGSRRAWRSAVRMLTASE